MNNSSNYHFYHQQSSGGGETSRQPPSPLSSALETAAAAAAAAAATIVTVAATTTGVSNNQTIITEPATMATPITTTGVASATETQASVVVTAMSTTGPMEITTEHGITTVNPFLAPPPSLSLPPRQQVLVPPSPAATTTITVTPPVAIKEENQHDQDMGSDDPDADDPFVARNIVTHPQHHHVSSSTHSSSTTGSSVPPVSSSPKYVYGCLSYKDNVLYVGDEGPVDIGRNSSTSSVHFHVGLNSFVSRKHLQVAYDRGSGNFYLICLSKNGVFVDDVFQRKSSEPLKLSKTCTFRFPSTNIRILFESFVGQPFDNTKTNKSVENPNVIYVPLKISIPESDKKSPFPSPTGTISAANSCPTSPRHGFPDYHSYSYNNNNNFQNVPDLFQHPSTSAYNEYEKPPYSYAQLIVQSISASPEKQLTLSGIYSFISKHYPYYRKEANKGWQNSIRHNLSLNRYFIKVARSQDEPGKGSFWRIDPNSETKLVDQSYKKRRQRGSQCFRTPYGMPRSAPVSPSHIDNSRESSPLHDIVLQSAPGSPGASNHSHHNDSHPIDENNCFDLQQLAHQSTYSSNIQFSSHSQYPNSSTKRHRLALYDDQHDGDEDSDEYDVIKRQKYQNVK